MTPDELKGFRGNHIQIEVDGKDLDFSRAKEIAKAQAQELSRDPMLLSWYNGRNGDYFPKLECGPRDKPVWIVFGESRGADIAVNINDGEFIFLFLSV